MADGSGPLRQLVEEPRHIQHANARFSRDVRHLHALRSRRHQSRVALDGDKPGSVCGPRCKYHVAENGATLDGTCRHFGSPCGPSSLEAWTESARSLRTAADGGVCAIRLPPFSHSRCRRRHGPPSPHAGTQGQCCPRCPLRRSGSVRDGQRRRRSASWSPGSSRRPVTTADR